MKEFRRLGIHLVLLVIAVVAAYAHAAPDEEGVAPPKEGEVDVWGGKPADIVKVTTFVTSMADWFPAPDEQQTVMDGYFNGQNPANSLVEISALAQPGLDIEIEAIVVLD